MRVAPVNSEKLAAKRVIIASFVGGVSAMLLVGLVPVLAKGSLNLATAEARGMEQSAQLIQPLDVDAIQATLADAERDMAVSRQVTDGAMSRLERLAGR